MLLFVGSAHPVVVGATTTGTGAGTTGTGAGAGLNGTGAGVAGMKEQTSVSLAVMCDVRRA